MPLYPKPAQSQSWSSGARARKLRKTFGTSSTQWLSKTKPPAMSTNSSTKRQSVGSRSDELYSQSQRHTGKHATSSRRCSSTNSEPRNQKRVGRMGTNQHSCGAEVGIQSPGHP